MSRNLRFGPDHPPTISTFQTGGSLSKRAGRRDHHHRPIAAMTDTLTELQNNPEAAGMPHANGSASSSIARSAPATTAA